MRSTSHCEAQPPDRRNKDSEEHLRTSRNRKGHPTSARSPGDDEKTAAPRARITDSRPGPVGPPSCTRDNDLEQSANRCLRNGRAIHRRDTWTKKTRESLECRGLLIDAVFKAAQKDDFRIVHYSSLDLVKPLLRFFQSKARLVSSEFPTSVSWTSSNGA